MWFYIVAINKIVGVLKPKPKPKPGPKTCKTAADCPPGMACIKPWPGAPHKICVPKKTCKTDADCPPGFVCKKPCPYCPPGFKVCVPNPKPKPGPKSKPGMKICRTATDCPSGQFCERPWPSAVYKICVACRTDADCPAGEACEHPCPTCPFKMCVPKPKPKPGPKPKPCKTDADCPPGQFCFKLIPWLPGKCVPKPKPSEQGNVSWLCVCYLLIVFYSTVGIYNTCILLFIAGEAVCEDQIPDTVTCPTNPLNGNPLSCDDIPLGLSEFGIPMSTICKSPISTQPISCIGGGNVEDYCRKTCSNCGINILLSLRQIKQLYLIWW